MTVPTRGRLAGGRAVVAALICAFALLPAPGYAAPDLPGPGEDTSIEDVRAELDGLYREAEVATEAYNAADEKATEQEERLTKLRGDLTRAEDRVADLHDLAGAAARTQYRGGDLAATGIQLLLGDHPDQALDEASQSRQLMRNLVNVAGRQRTARAELSARTDAAAKQLRKLRSSRADKAEAKESIEGRIAEAEEIEAGLEAEQVRQLAALERKDAAEAEARWTDSGTDSGSGSGANSGAGGGTSSKNGSGGGGTSAVGAAATAVDFALAQIGKPYVWGATGPSSYDCSGLTSAAWAAAGHPIPRTSQAQWQGLTRVSRTSAQAGDLIIYYSDATHVGMYIGGGQIVHAPRPGRTITTAPAASMPILGVVRPGV